MSLRARGSDKLTPEHFSDYTTAPQNALYDFLASTAATQKFEALSAKELIAKTANENPTKSINRRFAFSFDGTGSKFQKNGMIFRFDKTTTASLRRSAKSLPDYAEVAAALKPSDEVQRRGRTDAAIITEARVIGASNRFPFPLMLKCSSLRGNQYAHGQRGLYFLAPGAGGPSVESEATGQTVHRLDPQSDLYEAFLFQNFTEADLRAEVTELPKVCDNHKDFVMLVGGRDSNLVRLFTKDENQEPLFQRWQFEPTKEYAANVNRVGEVITVRRDLIEHVIDEFHRQKGIVNDLLSPTNFDEFKLELVPVDHENPGITWDTIEDHSVFAGLSKEDIHRQLAQIAGAHVNMNIEYVLLDDEFRKAFTK
jgi:hypothetical protein